MYNLFIMRSKCWIVVDSNERFNVTDDELDNQDDWPHCVRSNFSKVGIGQFCDNWGFISMECEYDSDIGVMYNDHVVFANDEFMAFYQGDKRFDEMTEFVSDDDYECVIDDHYRFHESNPVVRWYYFFCTQSIHGWTQKDFDDISPDMNLVFVKPDGFMLHKDGIDHKIGYTGAHVHVYVPVV